MRRVLFVLAVVGGVLLPLTAPGPAAAGVVVPAANSVAVSYDPANPGATVVTSSVVYTRGGGAPVVLTFSVTPAGRLGVVQATLRNVSGSPVSFGAGGVRVDVVLGGATTRRVTLRGFGANRLTSLAAGQSRSVYGTLRLPKAGTYTVEAAARY